MRHLSRGPGPGRSRGLTMIELMVGLAIAALLAVSAGPFFSDFISNSRLRSAGDLLYAEALAAQSEAVKRNTTVRLATSGNRIQVLDRSDPDNPVTLRERYAVEGASYTTVNADFDAIGRPRTFPATVSVDVSYSGLTCSSANRCPGLRIDAGGSVRLCADNTATC